jgi:hypothetical protein
MVVAQQTQDLSPQESLVQAAKAHGFQEIRATATHWFLKKGTANFKVPKREPVNEFMRTAINRIIAEVDQRANRSSGSQSLLPLAVNYKGDTYAVAQKNATQFQIQDLEKGTKQWVEKTAVTIIPDEELRAMPDDPPTVAQVDAALPPVGGPTLTIHSNGDVPTPLRPDDEAPPAPPRSMLDELEEIDPMAYWVRMTQRQVDNYTRQIDEAMAKIQPVVERRDALVAALAAASGKPISGSVVRRVSLPGTTSAKPKAAGSGSPTSKRYPPEKIAQVKELIRQGRDNPTIERATGVAASAVSYYRNKA